MPNSDSLMSQLQTNKYPPISRKIMSSRGKLLLKFKKRILSQILNFNKDYKPKSSIGEGIATTSSICSISAG